MEDMLQQEQLLIDAVNILLAEINENPIEDAEDFEFILEAKKAKMTLIEAKRAVLSEGWDFNTDKNWIFPIDVNGMIPIPMNVLDVTSTRPDVIMRNWRLYSKKDQSHIFEEEVPCKVIWDADFNSLSHPLRHYITLRAVNLFVARQTGDTNVYGANSKDMEDAVLAARRSETRTSQYNMLSGTYGINNRVRIN